MRGMEMHELISIKWRRLISQMCFGSPRVKTNTLQDRRDVAELIALALNRFALEITVMKMILYQGSVMIIVLKLISLLNVS